MNINWGQILGTLISEIIKALTPWAKDTMTDLIDSVYEFIEDWASGLDGDDKPASAVKMEKAVGVFRVIEPVISEPEARILLEAKHLAKEGTA